MGGLAVIHTEFAARGCLVRAEGLCSCRSGINALWQYSAGGMHRLLLAQVRLWRRRTLLACPGSYRARLYRKKTSTMGGLFSMAAELGFEPRHTEFAARGCFVACEMLFTGRSIFFALWQYTALRYASSAVSTLFAFGEGRLCSYARVRTEPGCIEKKTSTMGGLFSMPFMDLIDASAKTFIFQGGSGFF